MLWVVLYYALTADAASRHFSTALNTIEVIQKYKKKTIYILGYSAAIYIDFKCFKALQAEYVRYALSSGGPNRYRSEWCGWIPTYPLRV